MHPLHVMKCNTYYKLFSVWSDGEGETERGGMERVREMGRGRQRGEGGIGLERWGGRDRGGREG